MIVDQQHIVQYNQSQAAYQVTQQGDEIIVPVVMMTPGVRHGSGGPILHLDEYYGQNAEAWNGTPVTAGHPVVGERQVSVNEVSRDRWVVGYLQNARVEEGKLKADVHINRQRAIAVNPEVINYITELRNLDVSIGAFTQDQKQAGEYQGTQYHAVTTIYQPDHLALLPGGRGACSWSDGCGIRTNAKSKPTNYMDYVQALKEASKKGEGVLNGLQDNEIGFIELSSMIQNKLDEMDNGVKYHYLKELFDDYIIYMVRSENNGSSYYRMDYSVEENAVVLGDTPQQVRRNVEYVPMQSNADCGCDGGTMKRTINNSKKEANMSTNDNKEKQPSGEVMEKVVGLINNEQTRFTKSDRAWLLNLNEDQLETLEPKEPAAYEVTREEAIQALEEDLSDIDKVKELVTNEVAEQIGIGLETYTEVRKGYIKTIQDNTSDEDWPENELQDMSTSKLKRLAKTVKPTDYSGQAAVVQSNNNGQPSDGEAPLLPAGVKSE